MKRFSHRIGAVQATAVIQLESMSQPLRNSLWNFIVSLFGDGEHGWWQITELSCQFFFKLPVDELPAYNYHRQEWLKKHFFSLTWYETYDFIEFIVERYEKARNTRQYRPEQLCLIFNRILEEEFSGYRFIGNELAPLSNPAEVAAIESALNATSASGLVGAHTHIQAALQLLGRRPDPDYRNSVKESISAVEALAKQIGATESQGLSGALIEVGKKVPLHGGLKAGFLSLYGYTSDEGGIRHAMLEESNVGYDEAKYMVVTCSAFINFLTAKAIFSGLLRSAQ